MVLDMLGVLIGFAAVMLILSVIVTALVQTCQHVTGMRARNLHAGLTAVLQEILPDDEKAEPPDVGKKKRKKDSLGGGFARAIVAKASPLQSSLVKTAIFGGTCTWLTPERLKTCAKAVLWDDIDDDTLEDLEKRFKEIETDLQKRFLGKIRILTLGLAVLVAGLFQVSSFTLFRELTANAEYRQLAQALATHAGQAQEEINKLRTHDQILEEALEKLAEEESEVDVSKMKTIDGKVSEESLKEAFKDFDPARQKELLDRFASIVGQLHLEHAKTSAELARKGKDYLTTLDIAPVVSWKEVRDFYWDSNERIENWLGVLLTCVFLTFGAPFWFGVLQQSAGLRDLLKPPPKKKKDVENEGGGT